MSTVITIPALGDNLIYLCRYDEGHALVVDPGDACEVLRLVKRHGLTLTTILVTHHHWDHIAGVAELKAKTRCKVFAPDTQRTRGIDRVVDDGQTLTIGDARIEVIATPGHTRASVCYYMLPSGQSENGILFTGDTMFVAGCGRLIECDAQTMQASLQKLSCLPDQTVIYPGHDYTFEDYEFALTIELDNQAVKQRLQEVRSAQKEGKPAVPSTMLQERQTNPFLRADTPEIKTALNMPQAGPVDVFAELRRRKDVF
jgi:hydroxyacylglutathione hydrolase